MYADMENAIPVVQIHSFPIRIIARIKGTAINLELVTEDEKIRLSIRSSTRAEDVRSCRVYQRWHATQIWNLARGIYATNTVARRNFMTVLQCIVSNGIANKKGDEAGTNDDKHDGVGPSARGPDSPSMVQCCITDGVGIVERVVQIRILGVPHEGRDGGRVHRCRYYAGLSSIDRL